MQFYHDWLHSLPTTLYLDVKEIEPGRASTTSWCSICYTYTLASRVWKDKHEVKQSNCFNLALTESAVNKLKRS